MDLEKAIHAIIDPIVDEPESLFIKISESESGKDITVLIASEKEDTARLIGRKGIVANSIRELLSVLGKTNNKRVHITFESFGEEKGA